jgi:GMP synthase (glutamine-hydrolysing)
MRKEEEKEIIDILKHFNMNLAIYDYTEKFVKSLRGITDPEEKRRVIGNLFVNIFEEKANHIGKTTHLLQGTLYSDVIESAIYLGPEAKIKSHHNVAGLPEKMNLKLLEPLRFLFKDEVRGIGKNLGLPEKIIWRQPFPGPGLAIRIAGEVTGEKLSILREADDIIRKEIEKQGWNRKLWQYFGILLPVKSVGVTDGLRTYENTLVLRMVSSDDGMTAEWGKIPHSLLKILSNRIIKEVQGINRVLYDISSKPPATIEWE